MGALATLGSLGGIANSLGNLVLVSPQKTIGYQPILLDASGEPILDQPEALLFHYETDNNITLKSDITDHFVEDNTAIQDQIGLQPELITVKGFIGELNNVPVGILSALKAVADKVVAAGMAGSTIAQDSDKLSRIGDYMPRLTTTAIIAYNTAEQLFNAAKSVTKSAIATWSTINGTGGLSVLGGDEDKAFPNQNEQQKIFQQFYGYWKNRTLFNVQTPWAVFQNCAIQTLTAVQGEDTNSISEIEITFKVMRFASTSASTRKSGRAKAQSSFLKDLGTSTLKSINQSFGSLIGA